MKLNLFLPRRERHDAGREGLLRRLLGALGPSWLASPAHRIVQALCLLVFLALFLYVCWPYGSRHHAEARAAKEIVEAEAFLALDPLVSVSTALAARTWVWSLAWAGVLLVVCLVIPRGFCGYLCPFGTLLDLFDWAVGRRVTRFRLRRRGWWVHLKYYVLSATLVASLCGVLLSGLVAAIPVLTRGLAFVLGPLQLGLLRAWYLVPPMNAGHVVSLVLFVALFGLCFLGGALFSLANAARLTERQVTSACIRCGRCVDACLFGAVRPDFTTRAADCTFCQTCGGVCPVRAIEFVSRWPTREGGPEEGTAAEVPLSRRGFVGGVVGGLAAALGTGGQLGANVGAPGARVPVRPPGSVPEREFLQLCIRCGECFKACPFDVLQPMSFELGLEGLWTPQVVADWSGCEPNCNNCGQVCPTGAIRALPLAEKRVARMGLAVVDAQACLPHAGREDCTLCFDECEAAGYNAVEFVRVHVEVDESGRPIEDTGYAAPVVLADKCVGCGLCQTRCRHINVERKRLLNKSAVLVVAGPGKEDRLLRGSYLALRDEERRKREAERGKRRPRGKAGDSYLPDFLK